VAAIFAGCGGMRSSAVITPLAPTQPPVVYWDLQQGDGASVRVAHEMRNIGDVGAGWTCELEEIERDFVPEENFYAEYRAILCSKGDAHMRARSGCRLVFGIGMVWHSAVDLQLADRRIEGEQRWEEAARLEEQHLEDPNFAIPAVPTRVALQCRIDAVASEAAWNGSR
jgi:hypothetical protein